MNTAITRAVNHLFRYGGQIGVHTIFGGYDESGPHLAQVSASGYVAHDVFISMGSGSMNAYAILESRYKQGMTIEEGRRLAIDAISAGILYDNASGANVDLCILQKDNVEYLRNHKMIGVRLEGVQSDHKLIKDNIPVLSSRTYKLGGKEEEEEEVDPNRIVEE